jgi:hypothetical protein
MIGTSAPASSPAEGLINRNQNRQEAWSGLGAASANLWTQLWAPSTFGGVSVITMYLLCLAGLKISTPAIFDVVPANLTDRVPVRVSLPRPIYSMSPNWLEGLSAEVVRAWGLARFANVDQGFLATGLYGNTLVGVADVSEGVGNISVRGYTANVRCQRFPGKVRLSDSNLRWGNGTYMFIPAEHTSAGFFTTFPHLGLWNLL